MLRGKDLQIYSDGKHPLANRHDDAFSAILVNRTHLMANRAKRNQPLANHNFGVNIKYSFAPLYLSSCQPFSDGGKQIRIQGFNHPIEVRCSRVVYNLVYTLPRVSKKHLISN
jgi:hypothetical protein